MPSFVDVMVNVCLSVAAGMAGIAVMGEAVRRARAGPVRFRLPVASLAKPQRRRGGVFLIIYSLFLLAWITWDLSTLVLPLVFVWVGAHNVQTFEPRRDRRRGLLLGTAVLALASGGAAFAFALRIVVFGQPVGSFSPLFLACFTALGLMGAYETIRELCSGTPLRDGGIEMFGRTRPWSRIVVKGWQDGEGESLVRLQTVPKRASFLKLDYERAGEFIVPVPWDLRADVETFLTEHARPAPVLTEAEIPAVVPSIAPEVAESTT